MLFTQNLIYIKTEFKKRIKCLASFDNRADVIPSLGILMSVVNED